MHTSKVKQNLSDDELEEIEVSVEKGKDQPGGRRRLADSFKEKGRKLKLDRRVGGRDRRSGGGSGYKGPARRKVIDRRESLDDRRDED